jgi:hypothetical protein
MGLDIYCRWDGMTLQEKQAQYTGYADAASAGYLRYNWPGVRFVFEVAEELSIQSPITALWPGWEGYNGEELLINAKEMARLVETRATLAVWLANVPDDLLRAAETEDGRGYFLDKMKATVSLIDFIEAHKSRVGLRVEFN